MNGQTLMLPISVSQIAEPNIKINVPAVAGGTNEEAREKINATIVEETRALMKDQGYPSDDIQEMDGTFEIKNNQRGVLSLSLLNYAFTGGAHGNTLQKSLTFDAATGRSYSLDELFKPDSDYAERLDSIIRDKIKVRDLPLLGEYPGITEDQDYYIADKALVIYFPLYAIVPYAWGFPYFPISVYEIEDIIDEEGPLGHMLY